MSMLLGESSGLGELFDGMIWAEAGLTAFRAERTGLSSHFDFILNLVECVRHLAPDA